jgi:hypothetical protein
LPLVPSAAKCEHVCVSRRILQNRKAEVILYLFVLYLTGDIFELQGVKIRNVRDSLEIAAIFFYIHSEFRINYYSDLELIMVKKANAVGRVSLNTITIVVRLKKFVFIKTCLSFIFP